ncbi:MAG: 30S ribosomal protein S4e [Candidatus Woesearchaeota archaeon]
MGKNHLSTLAVPKTWPVDRKAYGRWIVRPSPGAHAIENCLPIHLILKNILKYAKTAKEVKKILNDGNILIDKVVRKKYDYPVGLMDLFEIKQSGESYRVVLDEKGKLNLAPAREKSLKLLKVIGKKVLKKGKVQINFHDGRNMIIDKFEGNMGDSVVYDLEKKKIVKILKLEKSNLILMYGGKHIGALGKLKDVTAGNALRKSLIVFELDGKDYTTLKDYAFVVGEKTPEIEVKKK